MPSQFIQSLMNDWPKLVATGILIPVIQWVAARIWQMRKTTRSAEIRKDIVAIETFISSHRATVGTEDTAIRDSKAELACLVATLENLSLPFSSSHPRGAAIARLFLLYPPPRYRISLLPRFLFFIEVVILFAGLIVSRHHFTSRILLPTFYTLIYSLLFRWLAIRSDDVVGKTVARPLWRRITLIYKPISLAAGVCQVWFWLWFCCVIYVGVLSIVSEEFRDYVFDEPIRVYLFLLASGGVMVSTWLLSRHLDRGAIVEVATVVV